MRINEDKSLHSLTHSRDSRPYFKNKIIIISKLLKIYFVLEFLFRFIVILNYFQFYSLIIKKYFEVTRITRNNVIVRNVQCTMYNNEMYLIIF